MEDPSFRAWVYHGAGDPEWKAWTGGHPDRLQAAELARNVLLSVRGELDDLPGTEVRSRMQSILASIETGEPDHRPLHNPAIPAARVSWWRNIAAGLVLAAGLAALAYFGLRETPSENGIAAVRSVEKTSDTAYLEITNDSGNQKLVNLPDGSSVLLMKTSGVRFPKQFDPEKREVYLSGEAFFEVRKNPDHPFFVYAGEMVTRVVGTSFSIRAYEADRVVSVRVKTGSVSVSAREPGANGAPHTGHSPDGEIILKSNQQAVLTRSDLTLALLDESQPVPPAIPIETQSFEFRRTAVATVFSEIEAAYNVSIRYDAGLLKHCSITASLGDEPLMEKLNMICEVIGAAYTVEEGVIHISATGCN